MLVILLVLAASAHASAIVEHSLDEGRSFSRAGRVLLDDSAAIGAMRGTFERDVVTDGELAKLQQLVEADR